MAFSCDPAAIVLQAKCFSCIPREMQKPVELYLLAKTAGLGTDKASVAAIVAAATCFKCIPDEARDAVEFYLLANVAGCT
jgi:hypothetical protein